MDRRLIEETFPIKEVSENSREEKEERRNNITTIQNKICVYMFISNFTLFRKTPIICC